MTIAMRDAASRNPCATAQHSREALLRHGRFTITGAGDGGWRVMDDLTAVDDPLHVVGFISDRGSEVEVLWVRGFIDAPGRFPSAGEALEAICTWVGDR